MTVVIDNPDDIIGRVVFREDKLSIYFRAYLCGQELNDLTLCEELKKSISLLGYEPQTIPDTAILNDYHLTLRDGLTLHTHIKFAKSIENLPSIKAIINALGEIQRKQHHTWEEAKQIHDVKYKFSICSAVLLSEKNKNSMITMAEKFYANNTVSVSNNYRCFWGRRGGDIEGHYCSRLTDAVPTRKEIEKETLSAFELSRVSNTSSSVSQQNIVIILLMAIAVGLALLYRNYSQHKTLRRRM